MAQLVLSRVGAAVGSRLLPRGIPALGARFTGAAIGRTLGSLAGSAIDNRYLTPPIEGPRIRDFHVMESREGAAIPIVYGRMRVGGQVIWAADFRERRTTRGGGKGGPRVREYAYTVSFAVGLCAGEAARVSRCWANGEPFDLSAATWRFYPGSEAQEPDPLIEAIEGAGNAPAYRGLSYIVFEDLPVDEFGARLPQLSFEVVRPMGGGADRLEAVARAVNLIPGAGEFALATDVVRRVTGPGREQPENQHSPEAIADLVASLDQLQAELPNVRRVNLVVSWFGDDLRAGVCRIRPGVDRAQKETKPLAWSVAGRSRSGAWVVSQAGGRASYGGTPSDASVLQAIAELKARGFHVTLYPFVLMDVAPGNARPDPYGGAEQAAFPWRGRITCHPAPGRAGSPDGTAAAAGEVAAFFAGAEGYRAFVLHYARLAGQAGGVDGFLIGTELVGLTRVRDAGGAYPAATALRSLAAEVRALIGPTPELSYAADWTEYGAHVTETGDVAFPLDELWADPAVSHVAVDWYPPMSDWREGEAHLDAAGAEGPHDRTYLQSNIAGGEAFDWYYADAGGRAAQTRLPITDGAHGEPWVFRQKDIRSWWANTHHPRTGGVRSATPTAWVPGLKPVRFAEFGVPAVDKGANQPNVFYDPKSSESALPHFSTGERDDMVQRRAIEAFCAFWTEADNNPISDVYGGRMAPEDGVALWAWDARPFPAFPARDDVWGDGENWRLGHWLNGRVGAALLSEVISDLGRQGEVVCDASGVVGLAPGYRVDGPASLRDALEPLLAGGGVSVVERSDRLVFRETPGIATTLEEGELAADRDRTGAERARSGLEAPAASVALAFMDSEAEHAPGLVVADGPPGSIRLDVVAPLALDRDEAMRRAEAIAGDIALAQRRESFALPLDGLLLEPGDVVDLSGRRLSVTGMEEGQALTIDARAAPSERRRLLAAPPPGSAPAARFASEPEVLIVDAPPLPGEEQDARPLAFAFSDPWTGPVRFSLAGVDSDNRIRAEAFRPAIMGRLEAELFPFASGRWQSADIWVRLPEGSVSSSPDGAVLNGANGCLVQTRTGWELLQFARAEQISDEVWRLSRLLRGQQGTDADARSGAAPGARVLLLDGAQVRLDLADWETGLALDIRAWRAGADEPTAAALTFAWDRRARRPWSPAHLRGAWGPAGLSLSWIRRSRVDGDAWGLGEPPLEGPEAYLVRIVVSSVVVRSWETATPFALYSVTDAAADLSAGGPAMVEVCQIGPDLLPGDPARLPIAFPP